MVSIEKEAVEIEALKATKRLIKIHRALLESSHSDIEPVEFSYENLHGDRLGGKRRGKVGQGKKVATEYDSDSKAIIEMAKQHSQTLGNTVLTLVNELISKYKLPEDLMDRMEQRIVRQYKEEKEEEKRRLKKERQRQFEANLSSKKVRKRQKKALYKKKLTEVEKGASEPSESVEELSEDLKEGEKDVEENEESKQETKKDDPFEEQFYAVLEEKFSIKFYDEELVSGFPKSKNAEKDAENQDKEKVLEPDHNKENECLGASGGDVDMHTRKKNVLRFKRTSDGFMVNFYTLSAAFINELQAIKSQSLEKRKEKALAELHDRIQRMKDEMEKIEDVVTAELSKACEKKIKKTLKLQEKMKERRKQVKEAKKMMVFYAMTGQHDKIREMSEELHSYIDQDEDIEI